MRSFGNQKCQEFFSFRIVLAKMAVEMHASSVHLKLGHFKFNMVVLARIWRYQKNGMDSLFRGSFPRNQLWTGFPVALFTTLDSRRGWVRFGVENGDFWCVFDRIWPWSACCPGTAAMLRNDRRVSFFSQTLAWVTLHSHMYNFIFQLGVWSFLADLKSVESVNCRETARYRILLP